MNEQLNVRRAYVRDIKFLLHLWEKVGYEAATTKLRQQYHESKASERYKGNMPKLERVLSGKIAYLGMVRGKDDKAYQELSHSFAMQICPGYADMQQTIDVLAQIVALS